MRHKLNRPGKLREFLRSTKKIKRFFYSIVDGIVGAETRITILYGRSVMD